ncbi:MAG TPA: SurA N-terminal domain-containing protein [Xanthomonadaceae bacterium]|jgi:peptidyl-prolyl cis-trans isomerase D
MLQKIREASSGWLAGIILGPLIVAFGLWGISGYFQGHNDTYAARITLKQGWFGTDIGVKYKDISVDDFRHRLESERQAQREQLKDHFDQAAFDTIENKRKVLDRMVMRELLLAAASRDGLTVSGQQLFDAINAEPAFQMDGKFNGERYREVLSMLNPPKSIGQFEGEKRQDLLVQALPQEITQSGLASAKDIDDAIRLGGQKRDLRYLELPAPVEVAAPADADVAAWYKAHAADYRTQEQVSLEYLELDAAKMAVPTTVDDEELHKLYDEQKNRFLEPEQRLASHILINVPANAGPDVEKAAQAKAAALATKARAAGADFGALAKANSEDEGSKNLGGDLGWLTMSSIDQKAFATALFALKPGQVSDPVRTAEGWHVIVLRDVKQGKQIPFETVRAQLQADALKDEREKQFSDASGKLVDLTLKDSTTLATAAKELGLTIQKTPLFARGGGAGIAANPKVVKAAFSTSVLDNGDNSDEIDLDEKNHEHVVVIRVAEHLPEKMQSLAQVHDRVVADLQADKRVKIARSVADAMLARAQKGETLDALATSINATVQTLPAATRNVTAPSVELIAAAFRLPRPQAGKPPQVASAMIAPDRYALVETTSVVDGDPSAMDAATRNGYRKQFAEQARGGLELREYIDALRKQFPVKVAEDRL